MKRLLFIYNPHAGKELLKPKLADVIDIFVKAGYEVTVHPTQAYRDAYYQIKEYEVGKYDLIACSGGDGTIDEVATGMMKRREMGKDVVPVGYIPAGTTNDFAKSLHIPRKPLAAADNAVKGVPFPCDIGKFNDSVFVYIAAFGLFTDVSYETNQDLKNILGHAAYILEGTQRLFNIASYQLKVETKDTSFEGDFIFGMVSNATSVGGFRKLTGPDVLLDDGVFEVLLIRRPKNILELNEIITALLGGADTSNIESFKTSYLKITSETQISWTLDGEFGGEHREVEIQNMNHAVNIILKKDEKVPLIQANTGNIK